MKKLYLLSLALISLTFARAQDIGVTSITSPVTGCNLSNSETVVIRIFNYGIDMSGIPFNVSYTVNGGLPVIEAGVVFPTFLPNSTVTYTFTTPVDLSVPGNYSFDAATILAGDVNTSNDAVVNYLVTNDQPTVGGVVTGGGSACISGNNGTLTLSGHTGTVQNWEFSQDGGNTWINISNNSTSQVYNNLLTSTLYRVRVKNGVCPVDFSSVDSVTLDQATVAGALSGNATVCAGSNSGNITLSGKTGNVLYWEASDNNGVTWNIIPNTTIAHAYSNLTQTTRFRTIVQNGACPQDTSTEVTITVNPASVGGNISGSTTVCSGSNSGILSLSGNTGGVVRWEFSTNGGTSWTNIANTSTSQTYLNLTSTRLYRALVKSGVCGTAYSDTATVTVLAASTGGTVTSNATVCEGINSGTLTLNGHVGTIVRWQFSTNGGSSWTNIANTGNTQTYTNLTTTTRYRAQVQVGTCASAFSSAAIITVNPTTVAGNLSGSGAVCISGNSGNITLSGNTGTVQNWEESTDGGLSWSNVGGSSTTHNYSNVNVPTLYRAIVQSGTCASAISDTASLTIDQPSVGGSVALDDTVCAGSNSGTLNLSGETGSIVRWQFSVNGGSSWTNITNTTNAQNYTNLNSTRNYRAVVQNGTCPQTVSSFATITVDPVSNGGTISGGDTVCANANAGTMTLSGTTGNILTWETSVDAGTTWLANGNTTNTETYNNLSQTTWFRAIVQSGVCSADTSAMDSVVVIQITAGGNILGSDTVCAGSNHDTLSFTAYSGTIQMWQFSTDGGNTWVLTPNNSAQQVYNNLNTTTLYRAQVKSGLCPATYSDTATVVTTLPNGAGTISGTMSGCEGVNSDSLVLNSYSGTINGWETSNDNVLWTATGNTSPVMSYSGLTQTTWYRVIVSGGACPADTTTAAMVTIFPAPIASFIVNDTCEGNSVAFNSTSTVSTGSISSSAWTFGDGNNSQLTAPAHTYSSAGVYNVTLVVQSDKSCTDTAIGTVTIHPNPVASISASGPLSFCPGGSVTLTAPAGYIVNWNTGDSLNSISVSQTATIILLLTDSMTGCFDSDSVMTEVFPGAVATVSPDTSVSLGHSIELWAGGGDFFDWTPAESLDFPSSAEPTATPLETTTYTVEVTDINGCSDTASVTVTVNADFSFVIPNMVTPNGDGYNDRWEIKNIQLYPDNDLVIFNRYGRTVFSMTGYDNSWGGTYNGNVLPDGTYHYVLRFNGEEKVFKGSLTILKGE